MVVGTAISAMGTIAAGNAAAAGANYNAEVLQQQAGQERAAAQRDAIEQRRRASIAQSNLQAAAGGSGLDAGVITLAEGISREGEYRALLSMYEGENQARGLEAQAGAQRYEGKVEKAASRWKAAGTIASGAASLLDRYGESSPLSNTSTPGPTYGRTARMG